MKRSDVDIYQPTRQSIAAILVLIIKFVTRMVRGFWPILLVFELRGDTGQDAWWQIGILALGGLSMVGSIIAYFKYYFHVTESEIIISKGILKKTNLTIPFDRVQSVDFEQTIVHQLLDVVKVKIDTAGSSTSELDIDALELPIAEKLRSIVIGYQKAHKKIEVDDMGEVIEEVEEKEVPILHVDIPELIKVGISQNHLRTGGLIIAFGFAAFNELEQVFQGFATKQLEQIDVETLGPDPLSIALFALAVFGFFLIVSFLITLVLTVVRFYDMRVSRSDKGFKLVAGLFNRKEISAVHRKVQIVRWDYNALQKLLGLFRVNIQQAASELATQKPRFLLPGVYENQVNQFVGEYFPQNVLQHFKLFKVHPLIIYRYTLFYGFFPAVGFCIVAYLSAKTLLFAFALILPFILIWTIYYQRNWRLEVNEDCIKTTSGVFGRKFHLLHLYKVQSIDLSQSWFERRRSLAHLNIHTAGGSITIPYLDVQSAQDIKNYMLYKVEKSRRAWM